MAIRYYPDIGGQSFGSGKDSKEVKNNSLWIQLQPKRLMNKPLGTRFRVVTENIGDKYRFLAPEQIQESIEHTWEPLENVISSLSQKLSTAKQQAELGTTAHKVGTPLMYKDSNRRELSLTLQLAYLGNKSIEEEVNAPIKDLLQYSSTTLTPIQQDIQANTETRKLLSKAQLPNIFEVKTVRGDGTPVNLLNIKNAALTSIQPTYYGPYINGYHIRAELTITLIDMEPLEKSSFIGGSQITTS